MLSIDIVREQFQRAEGGQDSGSSAADADCFQNAPGPRAPLADRKPRPHHRVLFGGAALSLICDPNRGQFGSQTLQVRYKQLETSNKGWLELVLASVYSPCLMINSVAPCPVPLWHMT